MENWLWLPLALGSAISVALADLATKRFFADLTPYSMCLARWLFTGPFLLLAGFWVEMPSLKPAFWWAVAAALPLELTAAWLYMEVLRLCPLSLCLPLLAFTPVFLILTGWLLLGETLTAAGLGGILLVASGSYILGLDRATGARFLTPIIALLRDRGPRLMLLVAALYACTAALGKLAILSSDPAFFGVTYPLVVAACFFAVYPLSRNRQGRVLLRRRSWGVLLGLAASGEIFCHVFGMQLAPAAYLIAVKRLSILFGVILGGLVLAERPLLPRLLAAVLMVLGVLLIAWRGG